MVVLLRLQLAEGVDQVVDDRRRQALARLVDQQQLARLDDGARDRQHLLLPARQLAGRVEPELLQRREQAEDPVQPRRVQLVGAARGARGQHHVLLHRQVGEDAHALGHVGDAELRDVGRGELACWPPIGRPSNCTAPCDGGPQAHDRAQRGRLAGAVAAQQHRHLAGRHLRGRRRAGCGTRRCACARPASSSTALMRPPPARCPDRPAAPPARRSPRPARRRPPARRCAAR